MTTGKISLKCVCGSDMFELPKNPKASDTVRCAKCGAAGKYGEVVRQATAQAKSAIEKELRDALRKAGFK